jgi:hypothetical protein
MQRTDFIYELQDLITEHSITLEQAFYCLCQVHNIEYEISAADVLPLYQKNLFKNNKINTKVLFRSREEPEQAQLDLAFDSTPAKSSEDNLKLARRLEDKLVPESHLKNEYREEIAQKFFKGDRTAARYFIIFKSVFPVRDKHLNVKWNRHFGFTYDGMSLWDSHVRVAKKFHEFYRKKDIGLFIAGVYLYSQDATDVENEKCWMTKPYKFMNNYEQWYELAEETVKQRTEQASKPKSTKSI